MLNDLCCLRQSPPFTCDPWLRPTQTPSKLRFAGFIPDGISTTGVFMPFIESVDSSRRARSIEFFGTVRSAATRCSSRDRARRGCRPCLGRSARRRAAACETEVLELPTRSRRNGLHIGCVKVAGQEQVRRLRRFLCRRDRRNRPIGLHSRGQVVPHPFGILTPYGFDGR